MSQSPIASELQDKYKGQVHVFRLTPYFNSDNLAVVRSTNVTSTADRVPRRLLSHHELRKGAPGDLPIEDSVSESYRMGVKELRV